MTVIREQWELPIVTASGLRAFLQDEGIVPWMEREEPITLAKYKERGLSPKQQRELNWAPIVKVRPLIDPRNGEPFAGFFTEARPWVCVVTLLPDPQGGDALIAITAEYKHGVHEVVVVPPCGVPNEAELFRGPKHAMREAARREYLEETGIRLQRVIPLLPHPIAVSPRQTDLRFQPFLGFAAEPIIPQPMKLDDTEQLVTFLMKVTEWGKVLKSGFGGDLCGITTTLLALAHTGNNV